MGYSNCPSMCSVVLGELTRSLKPLDFSVGKDFDIVTVSINPKETPEQADGMRRNYLKRYNFAESGWHALTGDEASITRLAKVVGFRYTYSAKLNVYAHAAGFVLLTPAGRISPAASSIPLGAQCAGGRRPAGSGAPVDKPVMYSHVDQRPAQVHVRHHERRYIARVAVGPGDFHVRDASARSTDGPGDQGHFPRTSSRNSDPLTMWDFPLFPETASTIAPRVDFVFLVLMIISVFFDADQLHLPGDSLRKGSSQAGHGQHEPEARVAWIGVPLVIVLGSSRSSRSSSRSPRPVRRQSAWSQKAMDVEGPASAGAERDQRDPPADGPPRPPDHDLAGRDPQLLRPGVPDEAGRRRQIDDLQVVRAQPSADTCSARILRDRAFQDGRLGRGHGTERLRTMAQGISRWQRRRQQRRRALNGHHRCSALREIPLQATAPHNSEFRRSSAASMAAKCRSWRATARMSSSRPPTTAIFATPSSCPNRKSWPDTSR